MATRHYVKKNTCSKVDPENHRTITLKYSLGKRLSSIVNNRFTTLFIVYIRNNFLQSVSVMKGIFSYGCFMHASISLLSFLQDIILYICWFSYGPRYSLENWTNWTRGELQKYNSLINVLQKTIFKCTYM